MFPVALCNAQNVRRLFLLVSFQIIFPSGVKEKLFLTAMQMNTVQVVALEAVFTVERKRTLELRELMDSFTFQGC